MEPHEKSMSGSYRVSQNSYGDWVVSGKGMSMAFDTKEEAEKVKEDLEEE